MKKSQLLFGDVAAIPSAADWGAPIPSSGSDIGVVGNSFFDAGDPYPLAGATSATAAGSTSAAPAKPVATTAQLANYLVNGFWQYNATIAHHWASNSITYNIEGLNAAEQSLAQSALQAWHEVANINFVRVAGAANISFNHNGSMQAYTDANWDGSGNMTSATVDISADWVTTDGGANDGKTGIDSYAYQTYIHELGHALGLGHQGPYNGSATYSTDATYANDTWQYSIMSYFAQDNYDSSSYRYVVTPQMADIYAVAGIYGAASTRTGNTVYGFNSNAGTIFDFTKYAQAPALTIYDSGGNDTLDCSGYSAAQTIDLHAGAFSSVGGLLHNIGIALNTTIECAIGGSGNDMLAANDSGCTLIGGAGNDTLIGGAGNDRLVGGPGIDTMTGGGGANTFVFAAGDSSPVAGQHDRITDFVSGVDHIDVSGIDAISTTAAYDLFRFIGSGSFDGVAGELDYSYNSSLGCTVVQGDTNGDRVADFAIDLTGNIVLLAGDFLGVMQGPIVIEAFGSTKLVQLGNLFELDPVAGGSGPTLKNVGVAVTVGKYGAWTPIGAEQVSGGYDIAWKNSSSGLYSFWNTDSTGNYVSNLTSDLPGSSAAVQALETTFQQDLNGDGVIGIPTVTIESAGSTSLVLVGSSYHMNGIGGTGPTLHASGAVVTAGNYGAWAPIGAEQVAGGGYDVAWKNSSTGLYSFWSTDSSGNYISNLTSDLPGASTTVETLETTFHQDLNGDGVIGIPSITIESAGSTSLVQVGDSYHLNSISTGTGPVLNNSGVAVIAGNYGAWAPIAAEQVSGGGYDIAWKNSSNGHFSIWGADSNGNHVADLTPELLASSTTLQSMETTFHQDLNGDGIIGIANTIEAAGSTMLVQAGTSYYLNSVSGGTGPVLKSSGAAVVAGNYGAWAPIGAEQVAGGGYDIAWKNSSSGLYSFWSTDSNGNFVSNLTSDLQGSSPTVQSYETTFHQDLNGDGVIGIPSSTAAAAAAPTLGSNWAFADQGFHFNFTPQDSTPQSPSSSASSTPAEHVMEFLNGPSDHQLVPTLPVIADLAAAHSDFLQHDAPTDVHFAGLHDGFIIR